MAIDTRAPRSRRAILLGALGMTAASVAASVGRANPVSAGDGEAVLVGRTYKATTTTEIDVTGDAEAIHGFSHAGSGLAGYSNEGSGVYGESVDGPAIYGWGMLTCGVQGASDYGIGVQGSATKGGCAILGKAVDSTGVHGHSGPPFDSYIASPVKTGVYGYANQDADAVGVKGQSAKGRGVVAVGGRAQLRLVPSTAATHPTTGALGDLFLDKKGRLWFCKGAAAWKQVI